MIWGLGCGPPGVGRTAPCFLAIQAPCVNGGDALPAHLVALLAGDPGGVGVGRKLSTMSLHASEHVGKQMAGRAGCVGGRGALTGKLGGVVTQPISSPASGSSIAPSLIRAL